MVRRNKQDIITGWDKKKIVLPQGVRVTDIKNFDNEDSEVMVDLASYGRRSRYWYKKRQLLHVVQSQHLLLFF